MVNPCPGWHGRSDYLRGLLTHCARKSAATPFFTGNVHHAQFPNDPVSAIVLMALQCAAAFRGFRASEAGRADADGENVDDEDSAPAAGVDLTIPLDRA
jgi:hypothetical protein